MNADITENTILVHLGNEGSRKKQKNIPKREVARNARYSTPSGSNVFIPCNHKARGFMCYKVKPKDALSFRKKLYNTNNKQIQDQFVSRYVLQSPVKRRRPRKNVCLGLGLPQAKTKPRSFATTYRFPIGLGNEQVPVCSSFFLHLTRYTKEKLRHVNKILKKSDNFVENRGGDRVSHKSILKKNSIREFIGNLRGKESHYNRNKSKRIYLSCDLSIKKLSEIYNKSVTLDLQASKGMFRRLFCREFNIGFRSPASDVCSYCTMLDNKIKNTVGPEKQQLFVDKTIHKRRAKAFYELLRENRDNEVTLCFDMQQVQPLPRTPIQQAFYARQLGLYNVCILDVEKTRPEFFIWTEDQAARGSTEVASALLCFLNNYDFTGKIHLRLFCDGCAGQNKNNHILHALMFFLANHQGPLQSLSLTFPVRGHSFLPADRVFGRVEKLLRKKPTIVIREEYFREYEKVGKVHLLGSDWTLKDVKSLSRCLKPLDKISEKKRIFVYKKNLTKSGKLAIQVKGNQFYRFEDEGLKKQTLLKKGWDWAKILSAKINDVPLVHPITKAKKKDVGELLSALFGVNWTEDDTLEWYKSIVSGEAVPSSQEDDADCECDCLEEDCGAEHV